MSFFGESSGEGFLWEKGVNCFETFAPVIPFKVLLLLLEKLILEGCHFRHEDISTAFPNGGIDGELHVSRNSVVYKTKKSLYGLMQFLRLSHE